jgi:hypothetical protein
MGLTAEVDEDDDGTWLKCFRATLEDDDCDDEDRINDGDPSTSLGNEADDREFATDDGANVEADFEGDANAGETDEDDAEALGE